MEIGTNGAFSTAGNGYEWCAVGVEVAMLDTITPKQDVCPRMRRASLYNSYGFSNGLE